MIEFCHLTDPSWIEEISVSTQFRKKKKIYGQTFASGLKEVILIFCHIFLFNMFLVC